jgi:hypothetical protein
MLAAMLTWFLTDKHFRNFGTPKLKKMFLIPQALYGTYQKSAENRSEAFKCDKTHQTN